MQDFRREHDGISSVPAAERKEEAGDDNGHEGDQPRRLFLVAKVHSYQAGEAGVWRQTSDSVATIERNPIQYARSWPI
ncbi:hypothetical protein FOIG_07245 [Fusarium odoratissimum NRRL 54006]|uniref:Uncharacterized protein n=2 Tax=Fusarium oxysporum species complex TaxID=171631 RepID=X0JKJ6_FUSO5|nr:uncharacterized protein FOIG_07245 [Fusarium odoratissimum NRRL 54006]EXM01738.1 hypothetical protein FOIG_07245 [Fusarium odoratissimum NRRL 54006]TXC01143.1 hypothetical protein FocTR4_00008508 [Fusarium oxysporum f. sp. cubense]